MKMWKCFLFGHSWRHAPPEPLTRTVFWECARCRRHAGTTRQVQARPPRWLFTLWKGEETSVLWIYGYR